VCTPSFDSARDAVLEDLLELVPGATRHRLYLLRLGLRRAARGRRGVRRHVTRALLEHLALLHEGLEHLHPAGLRLGEGPEPREPDLARRLEHRLRELAGRSVRRRMRAGLRLRLRFRLLQHVVLRGWGRRRDCAAVERF